MNALFNILAKTSRVRIQEAWIDSIVFRHGVTDTHGHILGSNFFRCLKKIKENLNFFTCSRVFYVTNMDWAKKFIGQKFIGLGFSENFSKYSEDLQSDFLKIC